MASTDFPGVGLHWSTGLGVPSFNYTQGNGALGTVQLALNSALAAEVSRAKAAEAMLVSGTSYTAGSDAAGLGIHLNGGTGKASFVYAGSGGGAANGDLAWNADLSAEVARAKAAEATLVSGTVGMGSGDLPGVGLHWSTGIGVPSFNYSQSNGTLGTVQLALNSALSAEVSRAKAAEAMLVSGTSYTAGADAAGLGIHLNGGTGKASFVYAGGGGNAANGDLAWNADLSAEVARAKGVEANLV